MEGADFLLKIKIFLFATLFVCSTYSATYASVLSPPIVDGEDFTYLNYLSNEVKPILNHPEESAAPSHETLDNDMIVIYPHLEITPEPERYTVIEGDNLYRIALSNSISLDSLMSWNGLTGDLIYPGDVLIVSGDENEDEIEKVVVETETETERAKVATVFSPSESPPPVSDGTEMLVTATAYTAYCNGCSGTTAYGIDLRSNPNQKVIAVDPNVIPLGTLVWVEGYGEAIAGDTGGAIKGNKIDVFIPSYDSAMEWGVKKVKLKVLTR